MSARPRFTKLNRVEAQVSAARYRKQPKPMASLIELVGGKSPTVSWLQHESGTKLFGKPTIGWSTAQLVPALPGSPSQFLTQSWDWQSMSGAVKMVTPNAVVWRGTKTVKPGELWIGERNMCTWGFLWACRNRANFVIWEHKSMPWTHSAHYNLLSRLGTYLNKHRTYALTKKVAQKQYKHWLDYPKYIHAPLKWIGSFVIQLKIFSERIFFRTNVKWTKYMCFDCLAISNHESTNTTYLFYRSMKTFNSQWVSIVINSMNCDLFESIILVNVVSRVLLKSFLNNFINPYSLKWVINLHLEYPDCLPQDLPGSFEIVLFFNTEWKTQFLVS